LYSQFNIGKQQFLYWCAHLYNVITTHICFHVFHHQAKPGPILSCPMPDEYLDYRNILESTEKVCILCDVTFFIINAVFASAQESR
jgi:hypothetical protein